MKRFTETNKWRDPWFRKLSLRAKALFLWLCDHCDNAGVIDLDLEVAAFDIGEPVKEQHITELASRLQRLPNGKWWIRKFIPFQYGALSPKCTPHVRVLELLNSHKLNYPDCCSESTTLVGSLPGRVEDRVGTTLKEKEEEKEQEEEKEKRGVQGGVKFSKPTIESVRLQVAKIGLPPIEADGFFNYYESNGWRVGKNPMRSWPAALNNWKRNYEQHRYSTVNGRNSENPRNVGIIRGPTDIAAVAARLAALPPGVTGDMARKMAQDQRNPSEAPKT